MCIVCKMFDVIELASSTHPLNEKEKTISLMNAFMGACLVARQYKNEELELILLKCGITLNDVGYEELKIHFSKIGRSLH